MKITFLAGYFDAFGTYLNSLLSLYPDRLSEDRSARFNIYEIDKPGNDLPTVLKCIRDGIQSWPDLIVYCGINGGPSKPDDADLRRLRDIAPTVMICPEASDRTWWWKLCAEYQANETFDLIVNIDGNRDWPGSKDNLTLLMPVDPAPWGEPIAWENRYVQCGFSGGNSNPYRAGLLRELSDLVTWRGPDPDVDARKTYHGYRDFMKNCRIAFNMAQHGTVPVYDRFSRHVKGRVVEAGLAAAALVDGVGPTSEWFVPDVHYVEYDSAADAREAIRRLMDDQPRAREMGAQLRAKVLSDHSPKVFWDRVIEETLEKAKRRSV